MGVMTCSRRGCSNIMCDTHISGVGYVCRDCQGEFEDYLTIERIPAGTENQIHNALEKFMETRKGDFVKSEQISVSDYFRKHSGR